MIDFNRHPLNPPDQSLIGFATDIDGGGGGGDKRTSERFEMKKCVPVVTVDEAAKPTGVPFLALTRNISTAGMSFVHTTPIEDKFVVVQLSETEHERLQVLVEILRCTKRGSFFEIGGRYLRKLQEGGS